MSPILLLLTACPAAFSAPLDASAATVTSECATAAQEYREELGGLRFSEEDRDAIARVTVAEAGNQGESGMAAVVHTIVNRLIDGNFGASVQEIIDAPRQFEPAHRAGGWKNLPIPSAAQKAKVDAIVALMIDGYLADPSNGALYFQNPAVVATREAEGKASKGLTRFGGSSPSAVIRDHEFYASVKGNSATAVRAKRNASDPKKTAPPSASWDAYAVAYNQEPKIVSWDVFSPEYAHTQGSR